MTRLISRRQLLLLTPPIEHKFYLLGFAIDFRIPQSFLLVISAIPLSLYLWANFWFIETDHRVLPFCGFDRLVIMFDSLIRVNDCYLFVWQISFKMQISLSREMNRECPVLHYYFILMERKKGLERWKMENENLSGLFP